MELLDIFSNPLVWALLAWLFSRFFTGKSEEDTKQQNQPASQPTIKSSPQTKQKRAEHNKRELQTIQQAYDKMKEQSTVELNKLETKLDRQHQKTSKMTQDSKPKVNRHVRENPLSLDGDKAIQGVIWSEILGAPRSKNPHYTRNRRHS